MHFFFKKFFFISILKAQIMSVKLLVANPIFAILTKIAKLRNKYKFINSDIILIYKLL